MKDQYFGDVNDYRKYGLLRALIEGSQLNLGVCWLRTANDDRRDGELRRYLHSPRRWRHYDPTLYDGLCRLLEPRVERSVVNAESWDLLPAAVYHHRLLADDSASRASYFLEAWERFRGVHLLFLDPDNGLEVSSVLYGAKNSAKYLYWREVEQAYALGYSLVIYQHFPREKRHSYLSRIEQELRTRLPGVSVDAIRTAYVVFLMAIRPEHARAIGNGADLAIRMWNDQMCRSLAIISPSPLSGT